MGAGALFNAKKSTDLHHSIKIATYSKLQAFLNETVRVSNPKNLKKEKNCNPDEIFKFMIEAPDVIYLSIKACTYVIENSWKVM